MSPRGEGVDSGSVTPDLTVSDDPGALAFAGSVGRVLDLLSARLGLEVVMLTRYDGADQVALQVLDGAHGTSAGALGSWDDAVCSLTALVDGALIVPDTTQVSSVAAMVARRDFPIRAYAGVALRDSAGRLLGSLCGVSTRPRGADLGDQEDLLTTCGALLERLLEHELLVGTDRRRASAAERDARSDALTGLLNRRGWDAALLAAEQRCAAFGTPAAVFVLDVDGLKAVNDHQGHESGDTLLRRVATTLQDVAGSDLDLVTGGHAGAVLARTGGDEFAVLVVGIRPAAAAELASSLTTALSTAGCPVSLGHAVRLHTAGTPVGDGLLEAWRRADELMLASKHHRRSAMPRPRSGADDRSHAGPSGSALAVTARIDALLRRTREVLGLPVAFLSELTAGTQIFRQIDAPPDFPVRPGASKPQAQSLCGRILDGRLPPVITDALALPAALEVAEVQAGLIRTYVAVPVRLPGGHLWGTLCCLDAEPHLELSDGSTAVLRLVAQEIATLIAGERDEQSRRHRVLRRVDAAVAGGLPRVALQPIVSLRHRGTVGYEALARFDDGRSPQEWFDDAAACGGGEQLELAAFDHALQAALPVPGMLAVNLSPAVIVSAPLRRRLDRLEPSVLAGLVIELTEHQAVEDYGVLASVLRRWRDKGLRLAVDDTGAGHSSLTHVLRLSPDIVKLDRALVTDIDHDPLRQGLVGALAVFCRASGVSLVAEGIETPEELAALQSLEVELGQGFHLGRPEMALTEV